MRSRRQKPVGVAVATERTKPDRGECSTFNRQMALVVLVVVVDFFLVFPAVGEEFTWTTGWLQRCTQRREFNEVREE